MKARFFCTFSFGLIATTLTCAQERIITAGSAITETVCAQGDCDKIIASDRTSLYPAHIQLPSIGYRSGNYAEFVISLRPARAAATVRMTGIETFADIFKYVGASNTVKGRYKPLNTEALISANPDFLLMVSTGFQRAGGDEGILKVPGLSLPISYPD